TMSIFPYGSLTEIAQQIRSKKISPVEIIELHLKRIEKLQPKLNPFVHLNAEGARRQARAAESLMTRGAQVGPLYGVPLTIKNCINVGGSIRVPTHFCGICGLKPTPGRVPAAGHFPPGAGAFSWIGVVGPMARTIADVRSLFEVMLGPDAGDALSAPVPLRSYNEAQLRGMRIGILESDALGVTTEETRAAVAQAAKSLANRSFAVEPFR